VNFGVYVPNFGEYSDPRRLMSLARDAEVAGWHGFFLYDHIIGDAYGWHSGDGIVDPWIALSAIATSTERIRLGPLVTALARRRPWKVARELVSLDHLSGGRVVFGVGLGGDAAFDVFGEDPDPRVRAAKLDEALGLISQLWTGGQVQHNGTHFKVNGVEFLPRPLQSPRIPIWVAGVWPHTAPFRRAARWDGFFPLGRNAPLPTPAEIRQIKSLIGELRTDAAVHELVVAGATREPSESDIVAASAEAGATWWLEWLERSRGGFADMRARVQAGPPAIDA
jgi:alkanesulfonate monooxygenase SsuD/methylene tetrahydromethanopterin reductase-like flavin-dependent oxidoreductase (luciferase family)